MSTACPLCFEALSSELTSTTPCAHAFCTKCLNQWTATGKDSCPICRSSLGFQPARDRPTTAFAETAPASRVSSLGGPSLRERVEAEHAARAEAYSRRQATQNRLDSYRSSIFIPSGRPYESLPVISLDQLRKELQSNNRRSLYGGLDGGLGSPLAG